MIAANWFIDCDPNLAELACIPKIKTNQESKHVLSKAKRGVGKKVTKKRHEENKSKLK